MKKRINRLLSIALCLVLLSACGKKAAPKNDSPSDNRAPSSQSEEERTSVVGTEADESKALLAAMLDSFAALDYEAAIPSIRESDRDKLDLSSDNQKPLYDNLFTHMSYELGDVFTSGGRLYVSANITAPDMLDVYGDLNLLYIDAMMNGEINSEDESREFNNKALRDIVAADDLKYKTTAVDVEIVDEDGEKRVVFTSELMNAMLGDIQTAQAQVSQAIEEGAEEYTSAKDSGAFD